MVCGFQSGLQLYFSAFALHRLAKSQLDGMQMPKSTTAARFGTNKPPVFVLQQIYNIRITFGNVFFKADQPGVVLR